MLALYRGALNREPDQEGIDHFSAQLHERAMTWEQVVESLLAAPEFTGLAEVVCGSTSYAYGTQRASVPRPGRNSVVLVTSQRALQARLDRAPAGSTVFLDQMAVVQIGATLVVPPGRTLATRGAPGPQEYANQARLVRMRSFDGPVVRLESGAKLRHVWVDGQRGTPENFTGDAINVQMMGGDGTEVTGSKISNSQGWTNVQAFGSYEGKPCRRLTIADNLITAYSSHHRQIGELKPWTDGISVGCERALVRGNGVVDATDVGIVVFRSTPAVQSSTVHDNVVLAAGNSAYGGLTLDSGHEKDVENDFTGTTVTGNRILTSWYTHLDIGISVGTRPWFGIYNDPAFGASVTGNTVGPAVVRTGIAVSGMSAATVDGNTFDVSLGPEGACPQAEFGIDADADAAGGRFQSGARSVSFMSGPEWGCIGHGA